MAGTLWVTRCSKCHPPGSGPSLLHSAFCVAEGFITAPPETAMGLAYTDRVILEFIYSEMVFGISFSNFPEDWELFQIISFTFYFCIFWNNLVGIQ